MGGTIYNNYILEPSSEWVLTLKEQSTLLPSFKYILSTALPNLFMSDAYFPVILPTLIRSWFQAKPAPSC